MGCCPSCYRRLCFCYYCCCDDRPKRNKVSMSPPPKTPSLIPPPSLSPFPQVIVRNRSIQHVPQTHTVKIQTDSLPRLPTPPPRPVVTDRSTSPIDDIDERPSSDLKSVSLKHDSSPMATFTNIGLVDHHIDIIVERYKSLSVKSLKKALIGLEDEIHLSTDKIDEIVEKFDGKEDKLLKDEAAAIYLYTMTSEPRISDTLKKAWSSDDPADIEKWLKYLSLYHKGLGKLEDEQIECWQGNEFNFGWEQELSRKPTKLFTTTGLGTTSKLAIKRHLQKSSDKNIMLIGYKNVHVKDISEYAEDDTYPQYALIPGVHVSVESFSNQLDTGVITFHIIGRILHHRLIFYSSLLI